jgi:hypothetical protein
MANTFAYKAGTAAATVNVPADARLMALHVIAGAAPATVAIAGGDTITVPINGTFAPAIVGDVTLGGDVVIGGTVASYFVSWMT